jgi:DNA processing protein
MSYTDEHVALCALNKIFGFHPTLGLSLLEKADTPMNLFDGHLATPPDNADATLAGLLSQLVPEQLEWGRKELERVALRGFRFLTLMDDDYPAVLRELPDPPVGLYLNGTSSPTEIFSLRPMIGIVGTRDISPYGREWCRKLVQAFAAAPVQPCIVSGMAFGADGIAHKTALDCGLGTVGVMATGIDEIYPWQHAQLADDMVHRPGCALLTDYPMNTSPVALNFLRRNRIIAGLCSAVIVVESKTKGGSLMTAKYAVDYDRELYALPGRIDDPRSAGCNSLIASNMARLITSLEELTGQLGLGKRVRGAGGSWNSGWTSARFRQHLEKTFGAGSAAVAVGMAVKENRGIRADDLTALTGLPIGPVMEAIGLLEANGIITTDLLRRCALAPAYA